MRIDREEKRSLKRLLVGILVTALVVTMIPFHGVSKIVAKAEEIVVPTDSATTLIVEAEEIGSLDDAKSAEQVVQEGFETYLADSSKYTSGMVINLHTDLDLSTLYLKGGRIPENLYFVLNDNNLYGCNNLSYLGDDYSKLYVNITGAGSVYAGVIPETGEAKIEEWNLRDEMHVIVSSAVDSSWIRFIMDPNSSVNLLKENRILENQINSDYSSVIYSELEGLYKIPIGSSSIYVEEISSAMIKDKTLNIQSLGADSEVLWSEKYIYTESALACIPSDTRLVADLGFGEQEYANPKVPFIVDTTYGLYSLEETTDGMTMIIYSMCWNGMHNFQEVEKNSTETPIPVKLFFEENYRYSDVVYGSEQSFDCDTVIFTDTAIPATYLDMVWESGDGIEQEYRVDHLIMENFSAEGTDYYFDMRNHPGFVIWNHTNAAVYFTNENNNELWVKWTEEIPAIEHVNPINIKTQTDGTSSYYYTKAGEKYTITPESGYTVYGVELGDWYDYDDGREYYRLADLENVTYNVDGTVDFIIPNFASNLDFSVEEIVHMEDVTALSINKTPFISDEINGVYWYGEAFTIGVTNYDICDVTSETNGEWSATVAEHKDGEYQKTYYIIDRTFEEDGITPSSTYGRISKVNYQFVLDTATPTITNVTAADKMGNAIKLNGGWQAKTVDTVWTNQPLVTLTVTADAGDGLPVAEYKFNSETWQEENTYVISGEGVHNVDVHARDEFDTKMEEAGKTARTEAGVWKTSIGIDTTAPTMEYTDANTATQMVLKSNTDYTGTLNLFFIDEASGFGSITLYEKAGEEWVENNERLIKTEDGFSIEPAETDMTYRIKITDAAGNETIYDTILLKAVEKPDVPTPPTEEPDVPTPPTEEPDVPAPPTEEPDLPVPPVEEPVPPVEEPALEEIAPTAVGVGRVRLVRGTAYTLGRGTWHVNGDSTSYAGGITFYVPSTGDYEITQ